MVGVATRWAKKAERKQVWPPPLHHPEKRDVCDDALE